MKQVIKLVQPTTAESSAHAGFAGSTLCMEGLQDLAPTSPAESVKEVP